MIQGPAAFVGSALRGFVARGFALVAVVFLAACDVEYPQSTINPQSDFAEIIHSLYVSIFWWTMLILAVVWVALAYVLVKFRAKEGDPMPRQIRGHLGLEIGWTVGPALIVIAIVIPTIQAVFATQRPPEDGSLLVEVTGHRFWWEFHYPEQGVTTANELWLPVDRPVSLRLGASDVIHSFWVPLLGGKRDLNPTVAVREGREPHYNWLYFTPFETGVYMGQCAEYCGEAHALMGMRVVVESEAGFQDWVDRWHAGPALPAAAVEPAAAPGAEAAAGQEPPVAPAPAPQPTEDPLVAMGRDVFLNQSTCVACHAINQTTAQGRVGPDLSLFGQRTTVGAGLLENTPENLARWIRDPQGVKPGAEMPGTEYAMAVPRARGQVYGWPATGLSDEQVDAVAAYLLSLR
jgi:cytochrome c oxidase subunit II